MFCPTACSCIVSRRGAKSDQCDCGRHHSCCYSPHHHSNRWGRLLHYAQQVSNPAILTYFTYLYGLSKLTPNSNCRYKRKLKAAHAMAFGEYYNIRVDFFIYKLFVLSWRQSLKFSIRLQLATNLSISIIFIFQILTHWDLRLVREASYTPPQFVLQ